MKTTSADIRSFFKNSNNSYSTLMVGYGYSIRYDTAVLQGWGRRPWSLHTFGGCFIEEWPSLDDILTLLTSNGVIDP